MNFIGVLFYSFQLFGQMSRDRSRLDKLGQSPQGGRRSLQAETG